MAKNQIAVAICSLFIIQLAYSSAFAEKQIDVVIEGTVYCQSCDHFGSWSLNEAKPIPSAKISVICKNHWKQVSYYKGFETDSKGYFFAQLDGYKMDNNILDHPLQSCKVKLVSSPIEGCNLMSNINYGINGASLRFENKVLKRSYGEAVIYAAGPLAFRPSQCVPTTQD